MRLWWLLTNGIPLRPSILGRPVHVYVARWAPGYPAPDQVSTNPEKGRSAAISPTSVSGRLRWNFALLLAKTRARGIQDVAHLQARAAVYLNALRRETEATDLYYLFFSQLRYVEG